jgi:hypothetical protein
VQQGRVPKQIARALSMAPYSVQDQFKSIFGNTGVRTRWDVVLEALPRP